ncbi:MAG: ParA family protein [Isosphaeraceae bacterium]
MRIIAVLNQKGGVGKTSLCHHLAGAYASAGACVLLVDNDPQGPPRGVLGPESAGQVPAAQSVLAAYDQGWQCPALDVAWPGVEGASLVPGSPYLREVDRRDEPRAGLAEYLRGQAARFDLALIDGPPGAGGCALSALAAADHLLIPVQPEDFSAQGIAPVLEAAAPFFAEGGWASIVIGQYQARITLHRLYVEAIRETHAFRVLDAMVPLLNDYREGIHLGLPVQQSKPKGSAAIAIRRLAAELAPRAGIPVRNPLALADAPAEAVHHG